MSPYRIRKLPKQDSYKVFNAITKEVHSNHTTLANAKKQVRLLESIKGGASGIPLGAGTIEDKVIELEKSRGNMSGEGVAGDEFRGNMSNPDAKVPLPIVGDVELNLPAYFIQKTADVKGSDGTKKQHWKLVSPTTAVRNLSTRKKKNSIQIITGNKDEQPFLMYSAELEKPSIKYFSKGDQLKIKTLFAGMMDVSGEFKDFKQKNKTRGLPEILPRNIEYHKRKGTSKVNFNLPPPKPKSPKPKGKTKSTPAPTSGFSLINPDDLPQQQDFGLATPTPNFEGFDFGDLGLNTPTPKSPKRYGASTPSNYAIGDAGGGGRRTSTPKSPKQKTPKSPKVSTPYSPTLSDFDFGDLGLNTPTPKSPKQKTPRTPKASTPKSPKQKTPRTPKAPTPRFRTYFPDYDVDYDESPVIRNYDYKNQKVLTSMPITPRTPRTPRGSGILDNISSVVKNIGNKTKQVASNIGNKTKTLYNKVVNPSSAVPPNLTAIKNEFGNEFISKISICRAPVPSVITGAMNAVSLGGFKKVMGKLPFDKLFHLYMIISTSKGDFLLEKNERINATKSIPKPDGLEKMEVSVPSELSVNLLLENTEKRMGDRFLPYSPSQNNCQDFILNVLESNNLITDELRNFVKQNTDEIFKQNPLLGKISKGLTDLGASVNVIQQGGQIIPPKEEKIKYNHINMVHQFHLIPQTQKQLGSQLGMGMGMSGSGFFEDIGRSAKKSFEPLASKVASVAKIPTSIQDLKNIGDIARIPTDVGGVKRYGKTAISYTAPAVGAELGRSAGLYTTGTPMGGYVGATLGSIAGRVAAEQANKQIGDGLVRRKRGRPRKMSGGAMMDGLVKIPKVRGITEPLINVPLISSGVMPMQGKGWLNDLMDKPITARQAIQAAKKVPSLAREAADDIKGAGLKKRLVKGSAEAKAHMARIRGMKKK